MIIVKYYTGKVVQKETFQLGTPVLGRNNLKNRHGLVRSQGIPHRQCAGQHGYKERLLDIKVLRKGAVRGLSDNYLMVAKLSFMSKEMVEIQTWKR